MADGARKEAVRSIEVLLGRYPSAEVEIAEQFVPVPAGAAAGVPSEVLGRRPDLIATEARVRGTFQNVQAAKLAKLPRVTLTAGGGAGMGGGPNFFRTGANFFAPIYDGGALNAQIKIETADQEQALAAYGQNVLIAFNEVENALSAEKLLAERERLLQTAVEQNTEALRGSQVRYEAGKISMLDVLQLQARTNLSRSALIDMKQLRLAKRIDLHLTLGGGFEARPTTQPAARPAPATR